jgi:hypothetical protein
MPERASTGTVAYVTVEVEGNLADRVERGSFLVRFEGDGPDSVTAERYEDGDWQSVTTRRLNESAVRVVTSGYSTFAISTESEATPTPTPTTTPTTTATPTATPTPAPTSTPTPSTTAAPATTEPETQPPETAAPTSTTGAGSPGFTTALAALALLIVALLLVRRSR